MIQYRYDLLLVVEVKGHQSSNIQYFYEPYLKIGNFRCQNLKHFNKVSYLFGGNKFKTKLLLRSETKLRSTAWYIANELNRKKDPSIVKSMLRYFTKVINKEMRFQ